MRRLRFAPFAILLLTLAGWWGPVPGASAAMVVPPLPANHVYDDARIFDPEQLAKVTQELALVAQRTGVQVYVYAVTLGMDASPMVETQTVCATWVGKKPGVVISFGRSWRQQFVAPLPAVWDRFSTPDLVILFERVQQRLNEGGSGDQRVLESVDMLATGLLKMKAEQEAARHWSREDVRLALGFGLSAVLLGVAGGAWVWWRSRRERGRRRPYYFPHLHMEQRLGAPFGGGKMEQTGR